MCDSRSLQSTVPEVRASDRGQQTWRNQVHSRWHNRFRILFMACDLIRHSLWLVTALQFASADTGKYTRKNSFRTFPFVPLGILSLLLRLACLCSGKDRKRFSYLSVVSFVLWSSLSNSVRYFIWRPVIVNLVGIRSLGRPISVFSLRCTKHYKAFFRRETIAQLPPARWGFSSVHFLKRKTCETLYNWKHGGVTDSSSRSVGPPREFVFDVTSARQRSSPWPHIQWRQK